MAWRRRRKGNSKDAATPTGSEGFSGTGSKEEPTNFGISLAQTFQSQ